MLDRYKVKIEYQRKSRVWCFDNFFYDMTAQYSFSTCFPSEYFFSCYWIYEKNVHYDTYKLYVTHVLFINEFQHLISMIFQI